MSFKIEGNDAFAKKPSISNWHLPISGVLEIFSWLHCWREILIMQKKKKKIDLAEDGR